MHMFLEGFVKSICFEVPIRQVINVVSLGSPGTRTPDAPDSAVITSGMMVTIEGGVVTLSVLYVPIAFVLFVTLTR